MSKIQRSDNDSTDRDRMIRMETKLDYLCEWSRNHIKRHWAVELAVIMAILAIIVSQFTKGF